MLRKRIIGTIVVKQGVAVQSIGFRRWLPIGTPTCLAENLDRWGADEIAILKIDRHEDGPDFELIRRISELGLSTPIAYGGGIRSAEDAARACREGVERIIITRALINDPGLGLEIIDYIGAQALIGCLPISVAENGAIKYFDYESKFLSSLSGSLLTAIASNTVSEWILMDVVNDGMMKGFNKKILRQFQELSSAPVLLFGGFCKAEYIRDYLMIENVQGILIGNSLNYTENTIHSIKSKLTGLPIRTYVQKTKEAFYA